MAHHEETYAKTVFGFWLYLLTDFMMFGTVFAAYAVLMHATFGGPGAEIFDVPHAFERTMVIILAAATAGIAGVAIHRNQKGMAVAFYLITFIIGLLFAWMQYEEFAFLLSNGHSWANSAYLSAYFTLVGTHFLHIIVGLLWILILIVPLIREGITPVVTTRMTCLRMFWQFMSVVWLFIFATVYLLGVV